MLYSEQVRLLQDENNEVDNNTTYNVNSIQDFATVRQETITLAKESFIYIHFTAVADSGTRGAAKVTINAGNFVVTSGEVAAATLNRTCIIRRAAGAVTFNFQIACFERTTNDMKITAIDIGVFNFPDASFASYYNYQQIANGVTDTVLSETFTLPTERTLPFGVTKSCNIIMTFLPSVTNVRGSQMQDNEAVPTSGWSGWRLYINDTQVPWSESRHDRIISSSNLTMGEGSYGLYNMNADVGGTVDVRVEARNNTGALVYHHVYLHIIACVWLIGSSYNEPFTLTNLPFQSTLYIVMEPLWQNETKTLYLGKPRFKSYGASTDYYDSDTGVDIVTWNYTFQTVDPAGVTFLTYTSGVTMHGMCISLVAADMR